MTLPLVTLWIGLGSRVAMGKIEQRVREYLIICVCVYGCSWEAGEALHGILSKRKPLWSGSAIYVRVSDLIA